jgi:Domain of unknown function (DUF4579)
MILEFMNDPEKILELRLDRNPYYPFGVLEPRLFVLVYNTKRHIVAIAFCVGVAVLTTIICIAMNRVTQYIVIAIILFVYFLPQVFTRRGQRILVLDSNNEVYEVSTGRL